MDGRTDGRTDAQMDGWTNRRTDGHRRQGKLGGEKENGGMKKKFHKKKDGRTNGWTDGRTDGWTDRCTNREMDGQMDGRTDGRTDEKTSVYGRMDDKIHCKNLKCFEEIKLSGTRFCSRFQLRSPTRFLAYEFKVFIKPKRVVVKS